MTKTAVVSSTKTEPRRIKAKLPKWIKTCLQWSAQRYEDWDPLDRKRVILWFEIAVAFSCPPTYFVLSNQTEGQIKDLGKSATAIAGLVCSLAAAETFAGRRKSRGIKLEDYGYYELDRYAIDSTLVNEYKGFLNEMADNGLLIAQAQDLAELPFINIEEMTSHPEAVNKYPALIWSGAQGSGKTSAVGYFLSKCRGKKVAITHHFAMNQFEAASYRIIPHLDPKLQKFIEEAEKRGEEIGNLQLPQEMSEAMAKLQERFIFDPDANPDMSWDEFCGQYKKCYINFEGKAKYSKYISSSLMQAMFSLEKEMKRRQAIRSQYEAMGKEPKFERLEVAIDESLTLVAFIKHAENEMKKLSKDEKENLHIDIINPFQFWKRFILSALTEWRKYNMRLNLIAHTATVEPLGIENLSQLRDSLHLMHMMDMGLDLYENLLGKKAAKEDILFQKFTSLVNKRNPYAYDIPLLYNGKPHKMVCVKHMMDSIRLTLSDWESTQLEDVLYQAQKVKEEPEQYQNWKPVQEAVDQVVHGIRPVVSVVPEVEEKIDQSTEEKPAEKPKVIIKKKEINQSEEAPVPVPTPEKKPSFTEMDIEEYLEKVKILNQDPSFPANIKTYAQILGLPTQGGSYITRTSPLLKECFARCGGTEDIQAKKDELNQQLFTNCVKIPEAQKDKFLEAFDRAREQSKSGNVYPNAYNFAQIIQGKEIEDELEGIKQIVSDPNQVALRYLYSALKLRKTAWTKLYYEYNKAKKSA